MKPPIPPVMRSWRVFVAALLFLCLAISPAAAWLTDYDARQTHYIGGSSAGALTDYPVKFVIWNTSGLSGGANCYLNGHIKPDWSDLRITATNDNLLDYYIESSNATAAIVWVKVPQIPTDGTTVYIYSGNSGATAVSNGAATFPFFDHFDSAEESDLLWGPTLSTSADISESVMHLSYAGSTLLFSGSDAFQPNTTIHTRVTYPYTAYSYFGWRDLSNGAEFALFAADTTHLGKYLAWNYLVTSVTTDLGTGYTGYHNYEIRRNATTSVMYLIDDALVAEHTTLIPTGDLAPTYSVRESGAYIYADYVFVRPSVYPEPSHGSWGLDFYAFGDSLTRATGSGDLDASGSDCYILQYRDAYDPYRIVGHNSDGGSMTSTWGLTHIASYGSNADHVFIMFGDNDPGAGINAATSAQNLEGMYYTVLNRGDTPYILLPPIMSSGTLDLATIGNTLAANGTPFIKMYDALDSVPGNNQLDSYDGAYMSDGVHPNATGHQLMADYLWDQLNPTVGYTPSVVEGYAPLTVDFTDTSTGYIPGHYWTFGDASTSTLQDPSHTYTDPGSYSVVLTVDNLYGTYTTNGTITVLAPPVANLTADFSASLTTGPAPLTVQFTDTTFGSPTSWLWTFGDGVTSDEQNPVHTYVTPGTYTVTLTAHNNTSSGVETKTGYIVVGIPPEPDPSAYSGIHITASTGVTASRAQLNGYVDSPSTDQTVWFVLGTRSGTYSYKTASISSGSGSFGRIIESYPLIAGQTYYARAACPNGYSAEEVTWTMATASAAPTTTYGTRADDFQTTNMTPLTLWGYTLDTGGETFGGGDAGTIIFISLIGAVAFIVLFGRSGDVIIPLEIGALTIGIIIPVLAPEFAEIGYGLMVAAVIGVVYALFRKAL